MSFPAFTTPPTLADIDTIARAAMEELPEVMKRLVADVVVMVEDFPDEDVERDMDLESPFDLLGLYQGTAVGEKTTQHVAQAPDMIFLYRRPLLDYWCEEGDDLASLVRHVIIHEIGHHFGFSDAEMEQLTT